MRAALLESEGRLALVDAPTPVLTEPGDVLVRVQAVGICGSEVHAFQGTHPYRKAPVILGHEAAGDVVAVGNAVRAAQPGDRVYIEPQWTCGACAFCISGDLNLCPSKKVLGTPGWPGAFGEYIVVPQECLYPLPDNLSYVQGALIEPLSIGVHVARRAAVRAGESVAILGCGAIGSLLAGVCRVLDANPIIVADLRRQPLDVACRQLGATHGFLLPDDDFVAKVRGVVGDDGVDVTFITADDVSLVNRAIELTKRRGRIVLVALLTESPLSFDAYPIISKELSIIGSVMCNRQDVRQAIELAASGRVNAQAIATHVLPIEQAQHGMELAVTKMDGAIKVILTFS
jgi:L-iditol 2-dehydrogenase